MSARLIYLAIGSLDGYVADAAGDFAFAEPDAQLHAYVNEITARSSGFLMGRRSYEVMDYWDSADIDSMEPVAAEFARLWRDRDKVVYSRTIDTVTHPRTRLEGAFDPDAVRRLKAEADGELQIGGSTLAALAMHHGLVDEVWAILVPAVVGSGLAMFPDGVSARLSLIEQVTFDGGAVGMNYQVRDSR